MSYSTLFKIDKNYNLKDTIEYKNSWLFSPIIFDELFWKYLPEKSKMYDYVNKEEIKAPFMIKVMSDENLFRELNETINNCKNIEDRILWELSNQQCFEQKDFKRISDAIEYGFKEYILTNKTYGKHIGERWKELVKDIEEATCAYIIHKNSSCDDSIERLFEKYNERTEECEEIAMSDSEYVSKQEFVIINNNNIEFEMGENRFA